MKKIGIITLYDDINIGNKLQNYAVQTYFEKLGFDCKTIPHWEMAHKKRDFWLCIYTIIKYIGFPKRISKKLRLLDKRKKSIKRFSNEHLKLAECIKINKIPKDYNKQYDYFFVGSDQVWHNWTNSVSELSYFFLAFAERNQRLTISPSFGKNSIEKEFLEDYIKGVKGFEILTCREEQGKDLIKSITGIDSTVLLDPTMLINTSEWFKIERKPLFFPDNYILVYALGNCRDEIQNYIQKISLEYGWEIVDIHNYENETLFLTAPDEFIYYIHHAKVVITDSFHACVFSVLFNTNFIVFDRDTTGMGNMSSRLDTLLNTFNLNDRKYISGIDPFGADFTLVQNILKTEREKAEKLYNETFILLNSIR